MYLYIIIFNQLENINSNPEQFSELGYHFRRGNSPQQRNGVRIVRTLCVPCPIKVTLLDTAIRTLHSTFLNSWMLLAVRSMEMLSPFIPFCGPRGALQAVHSSRTATHAWRHPIHHHCILKNLWLIVIVHVSQDHLDYTITRKIWSLDGEARCVCCAGNVSLEWSQDGDLDRVSI